MLVTEAHTFNSISRDTISFSIVITTTYIVRSMIYYRTDAVTSLTITPGNIYAFFVSDPYGSFYKHFKLISMKLILKNAVDFSNYTSLGRKKSRIT